MAEITAFAKHGAPTGTDLPEDQTDQTTDKIPWFDLSSNLQLSADVPLPPFRVVLATPVNSNTVRAFLSKEPRHISPLSANDALNRLNWDLSIFSGPGKIPEVEAVENAQPRPGLLGPIDTGGTIGPIPTGWSVDLRLARRILQATTYLTLAGAAIDSADGADDMAAAPDDRDDHPGITVERDPVRRQPVIVQNAGVDLRYDFFEGRYLLDAKADLDVHAGAEFLKKRIIRRLISRPGGFFHLPTYGVGLTVKEPFNATRLAQLRGEILRQIRQEEDVEDLSVDVASTAPGVLIIKIRARTARGEGVSLGLEFREDGQVFVL